MHSRSGRADSRTKITKINYLRIINIYGDVDATTVFFIKNAHHPLPSL